MITTVLFDTRLSNSSPAPSRGLCRRARLLGDFYDPVSSARNAGTLQLGRQDPASFSPDTVSGR